MHKRRNGNVKKNDNDNQGAMYGGSTRGGRGGYDPERGGRMSATETNQNILEQQNNDRISELSDQVARLKGLTIDIGNEVREQNSLLDDMGDGFNSTRDLLAGSLRRIGNMLEQGGSKHMCYMVSFIVFVMFFLYWVMSYKGQSGV
mmetsp:Transcript_61708/g.72115  ORF Transcript_61708/g.72115 Transcript_61708/m.72115 type:complete len:146 (-) Transcript_61708:565-1002(-)